jgi:DNA-binding transcriptional ArsR family regulator
LSSKSQPDVPSAADRKLDDLEAVFGALAHEQRRHILLTLKFRGEMTAGDIAKRFACSWPTTTGHLQVLEKARLLIVEKRGRERVYRLDTARLLAVTGDWLGWFED